MTNISDNKKKIRIIDETLREGMQFHGLVFSLEQRIKIIEFQEMLGVDVCQAGYPPALDREADIVKAVAGHARTHDFNIRTAALGRAIAGDADTIMDTGVDDPHFHFHFKPAAHARERQTALMDLSGLFEYVKQRCPESEISLAMLDMGKTPAQLLDFFLKGFDLTGNLDILSLPDTSGIMAPNQVGERISNLAGKARFTALSIHCHNDMGMACANTVTGILAGARIIEASALGIGERNGLADLYITGKMLADQGYDMGMDLDNTDGFRAYYTYINSIVLEQTGMDLLTYRYPVFGAAVRTHVAGTHAGGDFGTAREEDFFINPLCGKGLIKKYLNRHAIAFHPRHLAAITLAAKQMSMDKGCALSKQEIEKIAAKNHLQNPP